MLPDAYHAKSSFNNGDYELFESLQKVALLTRIRSFHSHVSFFITVRQELYFE